MTRHDVLPFSVGAVLSLCAAWTLPACSAEEGTESSASSAAAATGSGAAAAASSAAAGSGGAGGQAAASGSTSTAGGAAGAGGAAVSGSGGSGGSGGANGSGGSGGSGGANGSGGTGGMGVGGSGGGGNIVPKLTGFQMFVNCMPIVSPDPVNGSFNATYDNSAGTSPATATITSARLLFSTADWKFSVTPTSSGMVAPGATVTRMHMKVDATGSGPQPPCGFCNGTWQLEVTWNAAGTIVTDTLAPTPVECVF